MSERAPIVVAITGASGAPYAVRLLEALVRAKERVWLMISSHGWRLLQMESGIGSLRGAARAHGSRRLGRVRHALRLRGSRRGARIGERAHARHGDLSVLDGHARRARCGDVALARGARG